jgi:hypothetical protein
LKIKKKKKEKHLERSIEEVSLENKKSMELEL